jgi:HEAT repeat protein/ketosteroid isomerase-like protein
MSTHFRFALSLGVMCVLIPSALGQDDIPSLIKQMGKDQPTDVRLRAMRLLKKNPGKESMAAIPILRTCLDDKNVEVRCLALSTIGDIAFLNRMSCPMEIVKALLDSDEEFRDWAANSVGLFEKFQPGALPFLLKAQASHDVRVRSSIPLALTSFASDPKALAALRKAADDKELDVRNNAHVALWKTTKDLSVLVRFRLEVLGSYSGQKEKSTKESPRVGIYIALSAMQLSDLSMERPQEMAEVLSKLLADPSPIIRAKAANTLGKMTEANPGLTRILDVSNVAEKLGKLSEDSEPVVRTEAGLAVLAVARAQRIYATANEGVRKVLDDQVIAWNKGDLRGFMEGYWQSPDLSFYSGKNKTKGWQATLDRYRKKYQGEGKEMGKLTFSELDIELLGPSHALVRGRWQLTLAKDNPSGLFTLIFRKLPAGWRIVHDHTSN